MALFSRYLGRVESALSVGGSLFVALIALLVLARIVGRFFDVAIPGSIEFVEAMMVGVIFLGIAYTQSQGTHIRVRLMESRLSKHAAK